MMEYTLDAIGRRVPTKRYRGYSDSERFDLLGWEVDEDTGCWNWSNFRNDKGYGKFSYAGGQLAHRFSLERKMGRPIGKGMSAMHSCDNRACVNPEHLSEGTHADNMGQAASRQRFPHRKMSVEAVLDIRRGFGVVSIKELSRRHGVSPAAIRAVRDGRNSKWIQEEEA